jgi:hypothetical protein
LRNLAEQLETRNSFFSATVTQFKAFASIQNINTRLKTSPCWYKSSPLQFHAMIFHFVLTLLLPLVLARYIPERLTARDECSAPVRDTCTFYRDCVEARYHCGVSGYPIGYGEHYCKAFTAAKSRFDSRGKKWVSDTMLCLQRSLIPEATGSTSAVKSCGALSQKAFSSHADCYVGSGLCTLSPQDWLVIVETVGFKQLFSSFEAIKETLITAGKCIEFYGWLAEQALCQTTGICV